MKKCEVVEENTKKINIKYKSFAKLKFDKNFGLSKCVEIRNSNEMGRGLFASKNIKPGTIYILYRLIVYTDLCYTYSYRYNVYTRVALI